MRTPLSRRKSDACFRRAGRRGFSLLELLVATAVLSVALLPALGALRALLRAAERIAVRVRAEQLVQWKLTEAQLAARQAIAPADVLSGSEAGERRCSWRVWANPIHAPAPPDRFELRCTVRGPDGTVLREGTAWAVITPARGGTAP